MKIFTPDHYARLLRAARWIANADNRRAAHKHGIDLATVLPDAEIRKSPDARVAAFARELLPRLAAHPPPATQSPS